MSLNTHASFICFNSAISKKTLHEAPSFLEAYHDYNTTTIKLELVSDISYSKPYTIYMVAQKSGTTLLFEIIQGPYFFVPLYISFCLTQVTGLSQIHTFCLVYSVSHQTIWTITIRTCPAHAQWFIIKPLNLPCVMHHKWLAPSKYIDSFFVCS